MQNQQLVQDFPSMHLVRTGRLVRFFGRATFTLLVFTVLAMLFAPWRQTAPGTGLVLALNPQERPQPVLSPSKGVIKWVADGLREGSRVEQGEVLLKLEPFASEGVSQIQTQITAIDAKLSAAKSSYEVAVSNAELQKSSGRNEMLSIEQEVEAAKKKWEQSKNEVSVVQADLADKTNKLRVLKEVAPQGLVSGVELVTATQDVEAQINKLLKAENAREEAFAFLSSKEEDMEAKRQVVSIKNQEADQKVFNEYQKLRTIEKELIDLQNKSDEFDRLDVRAPRSGFIQQWFGLEASQTVKDGDQLFVIVPEASRLSVEMKVSGNDMPLIKEGDHVRLQFEGWPAVQFVGWPSVAIGTFGGKVNRVFPTDDGKGAFRIVVTPDKTFEGETDWPDNRYLRQGVRANGWVLLRQVTLGYEIWRQLNGFPPVVADEEPKAKESKVLLPKAP